MNHKEKIGREIINILLIFLWVYAAFSKALNHHAFVWQIRNQELWPVLKELVIRLLIPAELTTAFFLLFPRTRRIGLMISAFLLIIFTIYIALVILHFFPRVPCSCGGILEKMGWKVHFFFNVGCLILNITSLLTEKERRCAAK
ncbi:MauE/DoxX family redox-associated membrane protein [Mucilaginibacter rubeus]|uniref:MauE/DoxX family redox-associated membrane protein n=1 Tax=Mucilaginibacter rubeus TaxID=2027860 RepID=UPI001666D7DB